MKQTQCLDDFYKSDIVETGGRETFADFLNFADVNFKLTSNSELHILHKKEPI